MPLKFVRIPARHRWILVFERSERLLFINRFDVATGFDRTILRLSPSVRAAVPSHRSPRIGFQNSREMTVRR